MSISRIAQPLTRSPVVSAATHVCVNDADRMPFSVRDRQVLGGLMRRSEVLQDEALMREARAMDAAQQKVEIEALHGGFGMDALGDFLVAKIVDRAAL